MSVFLKNMYCIFLVRNIEEIQTTIFQFHWLLHIKLKYHKTEGNAPTSLGKESKEACTQSMYALGLAQLPIPIDTSCATSQSTLEGSALGGALEMKRRESQISEPGSTSASSRFQHKYCKLKIRNGTSNHLRHSCSQKRANLK